MPTKIFDATGNLKAINQAFEYMAHGATYILVGLQKEMIQISHPEFHKRESTLMSSRNATRSDFETVIDHIQNGRIKPLKMITHRAPFSAVKQSFEGWMDPDKGVIKAMVEWPQ
jgi:threonine dehydrogenase-like Zn-dependent dehydrogenase